MIKKIFAVTFLLAAIFINNVYAEGESSGATATPKEINHSDSIYYPQIDFYNMTSNADRIILKNYPTYQQMTEYSCGPAAALTVLNFFGNHDFDEEKLIKLMKTKPKIGTNLKNMAKFFKSIGWKVQSSLGKQPMDELAFQKFVVKNLSQNKPILVENVEFGGHWRVIIGVDGMNTPDDLYDDVLIFADPYDTSDHKQDGYTFGSLDRFYSMWFDHCMLPKCERTQPWLIATPN